MLSRKKFELLFDKYVDDVFAFLSTYAISNAQVKDWTQEVFIKMWEKRRQIDFNHPAFKSYLLKTARNHALKQLKKEKKYECWIDEKLRKITKIQLPEELTSSRSDFQKVYRSSLLKIPPRSRKAYLLNREEGLIYTEIANVMNISVKTVESHIGKALSILRKELADYSNTDF